MKCLLSRENDMMLRHKEIQNNRQLLFRIQYELILKQEIIRNALIFNNLLD